MGPSAELSPPCHRASIPGLGLTELRDLPSKAGKPKGKQRRQQSERNPGQHPLQGEHGSQRTALLGTPAHLSQAPLHALTQPLLTADLLSLPGEEAPLLLPSFWLSAPPPAPAQHWYCQPPVCSPFRSSLLCSLPVWLHAC